MDVARARQLIRELSPLAADDIEVLGAGTDSAAFRVDGAWVVRFPLVLDAQATLATELALLPELAPKRQNHLLGSSTVVRSVAYGRNRVVYTTFAPEATEVLRVRFRPTQISGGTFTAEPAGGGDYLVRVRHEGARRIVLSG